MIAVCAAKFVGYVCKKMGRQGVTWAGKVAIKICPRNLLIRLFYI